MLWFWLCVIALTVIAVSSLVIYWCTAPK